MRGKFIVLEGIDGSGKTTQVELLGKAIEADGIPVYVTREPSDGPIGAMMRKHYLNGSREIDKDSLNGLFALDRIDHLRNNIDGIIAKLDEGITVVCDRYVLSSMACYSYRYISNESNFNAAISKVVKRNLNAITLLKPDITFFIDLDPKIALERCNKRNEDLSIFESVNKLDAIHRSYYGAITYMRLYYDWDVRKICGDMKPDEVYRLIQPHISRLFSDEQE